MSRGRRTAVGPKEFYCDGCNTDVVLEEGFAHCTWGHPHHNVHIDEFDTYSVDVAIGGHYLTEKGWVPYGKMKNGSRCKEHARAYYRKQQQSHYQPTGSPPGRPRTADGSNRSGDEKELDSLVESWKEYVRQGADPNTLLLSKRAGKGIEMGEVLDRDSRGVVYINPAGRTYLWSPTKEEVPETTWTQTAIS
jgi:hypothetical protein